MLELLVVHCVDAEGPLGGNARRNPDGTPEFYDNWEDIMFSLDEITSAEFRYQLKDTRGGPWLYSWFPLDFTGFRTNPKCRDTTPHAVFDRIVSLPTGYDGLYFHHHCPPVSGEGDEWADRWDSTEADAQLHRRWTERNHLPAAFRAGGTIEDNDLSEWLERWIELDFSNRVSERSVPDAPLTEFNWYGAPTRWGGYHPYPADFKAEGSMSRWIYRCIDLRSRYNELSAVHVDEAFVQTVTENRPAVLSFFSHDNRDMRDETRHAHRLIEEGSERHGIPWRSCTAVQAHRLHVRA